MILIHLGTAAPIRRMWRGPEQIGDSDLHVELKRMKSVGEVVAVLGGYWDLTAVGELALEMVG